MGNIFNTDFQDFIQALNKANVNYLLVGGYAVILHGYSRTTGDLDIWVERTEENYNKLVEAFLIFRMPMFDMTKENFLYHKTFDVFRFGRNPVAIDIMIKMSDFDFNESFEKSNKVEVDGLIVNLIHYNSLIEAKKKANRGKDLNDLEHL